jgi:hypothetical protein
MSGDNNMVEMVKIGEENIPVSWIKMMQCNDNTCSLTLEEDDAKIAYFCDNKLCLKSVKDTFFGDYDFSKTTNECADMRNILKEGKYKFPSYEEYLNQ